MDTDEAQGPCTTCGAVKVPIAYGYPSAQMWEAAERGAIQLGGCVIWDGMPLSACPACDQPPPAIA